MASAPSARVAPTRVLLVACFGAFLAFLDATIVNVAFPSIRESFPTTSIASLSWVLNAYNIVFAAFLIVCGRHHRPARPPPGVRRGRRAVHGGLRALRGGSVRWTCWSRPASSRRSARPCWCPPRWRSWSRPSPASDASHAIGLWGASAAVAAGLGPPIGGALVELGGWRWAFFVNIPFGVVALWTARSQLVESRAPGRRTLPDLVGAALLAGALATLNLGIIKGPDWGWSSVGVLVSFGLAVVLFGLFVLSSRRHRSPLLDPALLRVRSFSIGSAATVVAGFGFYAYLLTNILWLQYVWGYDVLRAGLALVPGAVVAAARRRPARPAGRQARLPGVRGARCPRVGGRLPLVPPEVGIEPAFWAEWMPGQVLSGIGVGATLPLLGSAALAAIPGGRYATASAVVSSARQVGGVLGIAVLVVIIGDPTPATAVAAFRDGWMLSIVAFVLVALIALPLGKLQPAPETEQDVRRRPGRPLVYPPIPDDPPPTPSRSGVDLRRPLRRPDAGVAAGRGPPPSRGGRPDRAGPRRHLADARGRPARLRVRRARRAGSRSHVADRLVRELGPGDVLGELALLTGEQRSAGVRARRDSTVLRDPEGRVRDDAGDRRRRPHASC